MSLESRSLHNKVPFIQMEKKIRERLYFAETHKKESQSIKSHMLKRSDRVVENSMGRRVLGGIALFGAVFSVYPVSLCNHHPNEGVRRRLGKMDQWAAASVPNSFSSIVSSLSYHTIQS
jgi:hypothetical protein